MLGIEKTLKVFCQAKNPEKQSEKRPKGISRFLTEIRRKSCRFYTREKLLKKQIWFETIGPDSRAFDDPGKKSAQKVISLFLSVHHRNRVKGA